MISSKDSSQALAEVLRIRSLMPNIKAELKLPILDIVSPQLVELSAEQQRVFLDTLKKLIAANSKVSLFEYLMYQNFLHYFGLNTRGLKGEKKPNTFIAITRMKQEAALLLGRVCSINQARKPNRIKHDALAELFPGYHMKKQTTKPSLKDVTQALEKLNLCSFEDKKRISEEQRVGKECLRLCRYRSSLYH